MSSSGLNAMGITNTTYALADRQTSMELIDGILHNSRQQAEARARAAGKKAADLETSSATTAWTDASISTAADADKTKKKKNKADFFSRRHCSDNSQVSISRP
ncbi:hypothetical protein GMORB2_0524 [Geosmithia morbida]|uniref:Uncharacterized protein n=1 Tax=Geosmithia morbida TaxID=1094350 RepID=A0A9P4Z3I5_9HYPO|nr:uncharacterized protein GMORB2_0524 [Geosmithia morbida]KAF4126787.1 hypothetical protein GMORB2_0524 [Geosmithia morbida]